MNGASPDRTMLVACSVLARELQEIRRRACRDTDLVTIDSRLHFRPEALDRELESLAAERNAAPGVVLVFGDCGTGMEALERRPAVVRTRCLNCADLLLGRDEYRRLSHEGAFFVLAEWAPRWPEMLRDAIGCSGPEAAEIVRELHTKLVYLDTGVVPVPTEALDECSRFCGLPWELKPVSLDRFQAKVEDALRAVERSPS